MSTETFTAGPETAPSALSEDQASVARTIGLTGLTAVVLGTLILILNAANAKLGVEIGNNVGFAGIVIGMAMMFYHATRDTDQLIRRLYGYVGGIGLPLSGLILSLLPVIISWSKSAPADGSPKPIVSLFFPFGWACFLAGLFFLIPFCRNETEEKQRQYGLQAMGIIGALLALVGLGGGLIASGFALTYGSVMALLGLAFLVAYIGQLGGADLAGYRPALALGALGLVVFVVALIRSLVAADTPYFVPAGLMMMTIGVIYAIVAAFLVSDQTLMVLTRRELSAYFYSPVAYLVLLMTALVAGIAYIFFYYGLQRERPEPIVTNYLGDLFSVVTVTFIVPALTMRLVSEEKRTGTYEVLMCAPVGEVPVILSKLLGSFIFFMLTWSVWAMFLLALRADQEKMFEYRPLLSYYLAVAASGLNFLAMGVFFSCLTRSQMVAAVLTFAGMLFWLFIFFAAQLIPQGSVWKAVCTHLNYINLWWDALGGRLHLRDMVIQLSLAAFWCFLAVKVLEARRWS